MATNDSGFNDTAAQAALTNLISGGATVHLLGGGVTPSHTDGSTFITNNSDASVSVAEADFTIDPAADFTDVTTIANDNELDFGSVSAGTVDYVAIQNDAAPDTVVFAQEPNDPNTTGENTTISAGTILYELGSP